MFGSFKNYGHAEQCSTRRLKTAINTLPIFEIEGAN